MIADLRILSGALCAATGFYFFSFHESETRFRPDTYFNLKSGKVTATSAHATFLKCPDVPGICSGPRGGGKGSACC